MIDASLSWEHSDRSVEGIARPASASVIAGRRSDTQSFATPGSFSTGREWSPFA
jgi:hypothetical protein